MPGARHQDNLGSVTMKKTNQCPKCESRKILMGARVIDKASKGGPALNLELAVNKDPDALLFKGEERFAIRAWACADCGYTELYTDNADVAYNVAQGDA
jgi:predicted nucleic-acid-binding Zn-ribbon protein